LCPVSLYRFPQWKSSALNCTHKNLNYIMFLHMSQSRLNWTVWPQWCRVPCTTHAYKVLPYVGHAGAMQVVVYCWQFLDTIFKRYAIICSPCVKHVWSWRRSLPAPFNLQWVIFRAYKTMFPGTRILVSLSLFFPVFKYRYWYKNTGFFGSNLKNKCLWFICIMFIKSTAVSHEYSCICNWGIVIHDRNATETWKCHETEIWFTRHFVVHKLKCKYCMLMNNFRRCISKV
jgi:hypothetical protein